MYIVNGTELGNLLFILLELEKLCKLFQFSIGTYKFVPLSLMMRSGFPRRAINRRKQAINASVVRSVTSSMWTALIDKEKHKLSLLRACEHTHI